MLTSLVRSYLRSDRRGASRVTMALARHVPSLRRVPFSFADLPPVCLDLRQPTSHEWLKGRVGEEWERGGREVMRRYVRRGDVAYDIGSNLGFHTAHLSRLVGPEGRVYAFEPNPSLGPSLAETCRGLGNAELHPVALAEEAGRLDFFVPADHTMASLRDWTGGPSAKTTVEAVRLDSLSLPAPAFIKCDVEGAELDALGGAYHYLAREDAPVILFEACAKSAAKFGRTVAAVPDYLRTLAAPRYSFFLVEELSGSLAPLEDFDFTFANVLAVPAARLTGLRT